LSQVGTRPLLAARWSGWRLPFDRITVGWVIIDLSSAAPIAIR